MTKLSMTFLLMMVPFLYALSIFIYKMLLKKGIIEKTFHPYTEKRDYRMLNDIARFTIFIVGSVVFLCVQAFNVSVVMLIASLAQLLFIYLQIKKQKKPPYVIKYTDGEIEEWENELIKEGNDGYSNPTRKLVLDNDFLYWDNKRFRVNRVAVNNKTGSYVFLQAIKKEGSFVVFIYGAMGSPMFKRHVFIPNAKEKEMKGFLLEIEKMSKLKAKK